MARKEKKHHFVYKTTNVLTNRYYIGIHSTNNLNDDYLGSGRRLRYSINKYGAENHKREIIKFLPDRKSLIEKEIKIVNLNEIAKKDCMNLMIGGEGGFISEEQQRHRSSCGGKAYAEKLKTDINFRKYISKKRSETIKRTWESGILDGINNKRFATKKHNEETKRKMSIAHKGRGTGSNNSQYGTYWVTNGFENKKMRKDSQIPHGWYTGRIIKN